MALRRAAGSLMLVSILTVNPKANVSRNRRRVQTRPGGRRHGVSNAAPRQQEEEGLCEECSRFSSCRDAPHPAERDLKQTRRTGCHLGCGRPDKVGLVGNIPPLQRPRHDTGILVLPAPPPLSKHASFPALSAQDFP